MAIVPFPALAIRSIEWDLDRPGQVNTSQWTGTDQVDPKLWLGRWYCTAEMVAILGEPNIRAWRSFLAKMKGRGNTTRIVAVEEDQHSLAGAQSVYTGHAAGVTTILTKGWPGGTTLLDGQMFTINDQLVILTQDATPHAEPGARYLTFEPPLRKPAAHDLVIETKRPTALVAFTDSRIGWSVGPGRQRGAGFSAKERP